MLHSPSPPARPASSVRSPGALPPRIQHIRHADWCDRAGLGNFVILDHIARAKGAGLPYVYLGYWIEASPKMAYKDQFRPHEKLVAGQWQGQAT